MSAVDADDLPGLHFFTHGIRRYLDAVTPRGDTVLTRSGPAQDPAVGAVRERIPPRAWRLRTQSARNGSAG
ncbi:hypothetical protein ACQEVF_07215 [Nonomuraea polychroma]|uniref:hypothetical protein n=1 Tax=Nonomuraea polychroma TaxID=46176 RepID=UPI003D916015